jgi:hypothetical protein
MSALRADLIEPQARHYNHARLVGIIAERDKLLALPK